MKVSPYMSTKVLNLLTIKVSEACKAIFLFMFLLGTTHLASAQTRCEFDLDAAWPHIWGVLKKSDMSDAVWPQFLAKIQNGAVSEVVSGSRSANQTNGGQIRHRLVGVNVASSNGFCKTGLLEINEAVVELYIDSSESSGGETYPTVFNWTIGLRGDGRGIESAGVLQVALCSSGFWRDLGTASADRASRARNCLSRNASTNPQRCAQRGCGFAVSAAGSTPNPAALSSSPATVSSGYNFRPEVRHLFVGNQMAPGNLNDRRDDLMFYIEQPQFPASLRAFNTTHTRFAFLEVFSATGTFLQSSSSFADGVLEGYIATDTFYSRWQAGTYGYYFKFSGVQGSSIFLESGRPFGLFNAQVCRVDESNARSGISGSTALRTQLLPQIRADMTQNLPNGCNPYTVTCDKQSCSRRRTQEQFLNELHAGFASSGIDPAWPTAIASSVQRIETEKVRRLEAEERERLARAEREKLAKAQAERDAVLKAEADRVNAARAEVERKQYEARRAKEEADFNALLRSSSPRTMYTAAVLMEDSGDKGKAKTIYREILKRFPNAQESIAAGQRLTSLRDVEAVEASNSNAASRAESAAQGLRSQNYQQCIAEESSCYSRCSDIRNSSAASTCRSGCFKGCKQ